MTDDEAEGLRYEVRHGDHIWDVKLGSYVTITDESEAQTICDELNAADRPHAVLRRLMDEGRAY
jgi:hypothetical protein